MALKGKWTGQKCIRDEPHQARLKNTSQSWITSIILGLNLDKLIGMALVCLCVSAWERVNCLCLIGLNVIFDYTKSKTQSKCDSGLGFITCRTWVFQQALSSPFVARTLLALWMSVLAMSQLNRDSIGCLIVETALENRSSAVLFRCLVSSCCLFTPLTKSKHKRIGIDG